MSQKIYGVIVAFFLMVISQGLFAQNDILLGVKAGISIPNLTTGTTNDPVSSGWSSREGPYFGAVAEFKVTDRFSLQIELNYSSQGGKKNGEQALPNVYTGNPPYVYANFNDESKLNYIELPILAKFYFPLGKKLKFFVDLGPYAGYLVAAKQVTSGSSNIYADQAETQPFLQQAISFDSTQDIKSDIKKFNVGVQGGIGLSLNAGMGNLFFTIGGNYGFIPIQKDKSNGQNNTGTATVTLGYLFKL